MIKQLKKEIPKTKKEWLVLGIAIIAFIAVFAFMWAPKLKADKTVYMNRVYLINNEADLKINKHSVVIATDPDATVPFISKGSEKTIPYDYKGTEQTINLDYGDFDKLVITSDGNYVKLYTTDDYGKSKTYKFEYYPDYSKDEIKKLKKAGNSSTAYSKALQAILDN
ncbi:MAG: hypothetical protein LBT37_05345 [Lactobacillaceae bacterium]|jgi:hypothetical protein|nr:hypothetical protein [Lactobacillaceae bacterium]